MNMSEDKIKRLKSIADLRDSGALTESEFQELKSKILSETSSQTNEKLSFSNYKEHLNVKTVVIGGVLGVIILILIMFVFNLQFSKTLIDFSIFSSLIVALYFSYNIKDIFNKDIKIG